MTIRLWLYAAAVVAAAAFLATSHSMAYARGKESVQREWDAAKARAALKTQRDQRTLGMIEGTLQETLDANRDTEPVIAVVPERVCPESGVPAAADHPRRAPEPRAEAETAALGEAVAHDAGRYASCWAKLNAAQAALRLLGDQERPK